MIQGILVDTHTQAQRQERDVMVWLAGKNVQDHDLHSVHVDGPDR
jgi:hypothetical protein